MHVCVITSNVTYLWCTYMY